MPALMQKEPVFLIKVGPKKGLGSKEPVFLIKVGPKKGLGSGPTPSSCLCVFVRDYIGAGLPSARTRRGA